MEDEVRALRERIVQRELSWDHVRVAAFLGDPLAEATFAKAPSTLGPYEAPQEARSFLSRFRRRPPHADLAAWVRGIERLSAEARLRLALALARRLLTVWESYHPRRPEPRVALEAVADLLVVGTPAREEGVPLSLLEACHASPRSSVCPSGLRRTAPLIALWLLRSCGERSLADLVPPTLEVLGAALGEAAGQAARERSQARGASDFQAWEAAKAERALAGSPVKAEAEFRRVARQALRLWVLEGPEIDPQGPLASSDTRWVEACLAEVVGVGLGPGGPGSLDPDFGAQALSFLVGGGILGAALKADQAIDAQLARRRVMDDPEARWDCPKCATLNPNTTRLCSGCRFVLR